MGPGCDLFDYIATCLHTFMERHGLEGKSLPLGFTFSFPLIQVYRRLCKTILVLDLSLSMDKTTWFFLIINKRTLRLKCAAKVIQIVGEYFPWLGWLSYRTSSTLDQRLQMLRCGGEKLTSHCTFSILVLNFNSVDSGRGCGGSPKAGCEKAWSEHWGLIFLWKFF